MDKELLRKEQKEWLKRLTLLDLKTRSCLIETKLLTYLHSLQNKSPNILVVGLYLPLSGEPLWDLLLWEKTQFLIACPALNHGRMEYQHNPDLKGKGPWLKKEGMMVKPDVVVVPGLAFSDCGWRLGRGGGWFDKMLEINSPLAIGVCFGEQLFKGQKWKPEDHDKKMDVIITETSIIGCSKKMVE